MRQRPQKALLADMQNEFADFVSLDEKSYRIAIADIQRKMESLTIINKQFEPQPLIFWNEQQHYFDTIMDRLERRLPIRDLILKARQLGFSTIIQAFAFTIVTWLFPNVYFYLVAQDQEMAELIFDRTNRFYHELPPNQQRRLTGNRVNQQRLSYAKPWHSKIIVTTAMKFSLARGLTPLGYHFSEYATWPGKPEQVRLSIHNAMPKPNENPFTIGCIESTGRVGHFYQLWQDAEAGKNGFMTHFYPWLTKTTYSLPLQGTEILRNAVYSEKDPEIQEYIKARDINRNQVKWLLETLERDCGNELRLFSQEYPSTPADAFQLDSAAWFKVNALLRLEQRVASNPPIFTGFVQPDSRFIDKIVYEFVSRPIGNLLIWENYILGAAYVMGQDVGEGIDQAYCVAYVMRCPDPPGLNTENPCREHRIVAELRDNITSPEEFTIQAWCLGHSYGYQLWCIERTGMGLSACRVAGGDGLAPYRAFRKYPRLYTEISYNKELQQDTRVVGYFTGGTSKLALLGHFRRAVNEGTFTMFSSHLLHEMKGFTWIAGDKGSRGTWEQTSVDPKTKKGQDDCIMAAALTYEMAHVDIETAMFAQAGSCDR